MLVNPCIALEEIAPNCVDDISLTTVGLSAAISADDRPGMARPARASTWFPLMLKTSSLLNAATCADAIAATAAVEKPATLSTVNAAICAVVKDRICAAV